MNLTRAVFVLLIVCFVSAFSLAQEKSSKDKEKAPPVEVKANVLVKDAADNFVNDIKIENIKVFEDGVEQKITYFSKKEPVLNVGLVMDNTGSLRIMLDEEVAAGMAFMKYLIKDDEAFIVRFVSSDKITLEQDWTSNSARLSQALNNLYIEGGQSAVIDGIYVSAGKILERERKEKARRYALILFTDGEDRASSFNEAQLFERFKDTDIQVFPVIFPMDYAGKQEKSIKRFVNTVALRTGGTAFFLDSKSRKGVKFRDALLAAVKKIADELRSQYVVGYTSTNSKRDGETRKLTVQIADGEKGEKRQGFIRESFVVPEEK